MRPARSVSRLAGCRMLCQVHTSENNSVKMHHYREHLLQSDVLDCIWLVGQTQGAMTRYLNAMQDGKQLDYRAIGESLRASVKKTKLMCELTLAKEEVAECPIPPEDWGSLETSLISIADIEAELDTWPQYNDDIIEQAIAENQAARSNAEPACSAWTTSDHCTSH